MIHTIIFDWKGTLYDKQSRTLFPGVPHILNLLKRKNIKRILIGKGGDEMYQEVIRLHIVSLFNRVSFIQRSKNTEDFSPYVDPESPGDTWIIGDRIRSEIALGNMLGATTVWIASGIFANEEPRNTAEAPTFRIGSLSEFMAHVQ
jgi:ribonucleotide monophosphatase NagD (HAD superfamily)